MQNLERDKMEIDGELNAVKKQVKQLEKERESYFAEADVMTTNCMNAMNEVSSSILCIVH